MRGDGRPRVGRGDAQVVGSPGSFEAFYAKEVRSVFAVTLGLTRNRWEAEEVTQEAFFRAYRDWGAVGLMDGSGAWVRRVALNLAVGRWRRKQLEARALLRLRHQPASTELAPEAIEFWREVRALPPRQAQVVALTYVDDLGAEEVAAVLRISPATVRVHLSRARATLARRLEREA
jgi:RNA polymerase sigma-70 factor (ECF subfamily)